MAQIKRLIVCCDGTWNDSISTNSPLTNVARFSRCVKERAGDGILQIVYYHTGVGVGTSRISNSIDGAVGRGLGANVRNAYNFICQNYNHQDCNDEIYLLGFSRGAFTVRCVASLVDSIGILTKPGLSRLYEAYGLWKMSDNESVLKTFVEDLRSKGLVKTGIKIKACGVWDTVSAIGVQLPSWLPQPPTKRLIHVDSRVPLCIENAFHAMALDERRSAFWPLPWSEPHSHVNFRQCWFPGAHADVGGGYEDAGLANVALVWMVAQFQHFTSLAFDVTYLLDFLVTREVELKRKEMSAFVGIGGIGCEIKRVEETSKYKGEAGKIANSFTLFWQPFGQRLRKPGTSLLIDKVQHNIGTTGAEDDLRPGTSPTPQDGLNTGTVVGSEQAHTGAYSALDVQKYRPPRATCDTIHFTVRVLLAKQYHSCQVLKNFCTKICSINSQKVCWEQLQGHHKGKNKTPMPMANQPLSIDEAEVTDTESELLRLWLNAAAKRGILYSDRKESRRRFFLDGSQPTSDASNVSSHDFSLPYPFQENEYLKAVLDEIEKASPLDLWVRLGVHLEESVRPTLMFNCNAAESK